MGGVFLFKNQQWSEPVQGTVLRVICIWCCCLVFLSGGISAANPIQDPETVVWNLSADTVAYDRHTDVYTAQTNVEIIGGKTRLEADYVEFSNTTKDVSAKGHVKMISGGDVISCNAMQVNLITETGMIDKGTVFIQENHLYLHGEQIRKTGKFTYDARKGSITSCDGDTPDWKITGKDVKVTIEGYGFAKDTVFWARNMPALYSPFLAFPVKTQRQSGLLMPEISTSDRQGFVYEQPFFWAISPESDATFYTGYLSDRGLKIGAEYRYVMDEVSKGIWQMDFMDDDKIDDGTSATKDYRFESTPQRTNTDRYWLRGKSNQALPYEFSARLDVDVVSDADYLLEFQDGPSGYDTSDRIFEDEFGRDLDEYNNKVRKNSLALSRTWDNFALNFQTLWYDDVIARQKDRDDTTLQTLPGIEFGSSRLNVGNTGIYYRLDSEFRSFFRQDTIDTAAGQRETAKVNGRRLDMYHRFYYPARLGKAFSFEPFMGLRGTAYHTDSYTDINGQEDPLRFRGLYDLGGELSTRLSRVFAANTGFADKIMHQVTPGISYHFQPYEDQEDLPYFDALDDIEETNRLTWSFTNRFIARKSTAGPDNTIQNKYRELGWIKLFQDYSIKDERDNGEAKGRPWSDIKLDARVYPFSFLSLRTDLAWSPYDYHFNVLNLNTTVTTPRGDAVTTAYRYSMDTRETWYTRFDLRITRSLTAYHSFEKNLARDTTIETRTGIRLNSACWAMGLELQESDMDRRIAFMINLKGIGEFGSQ